MKVHELKVWPEYFHSLLNGTKAFEVRKNDRDFQEGDILILREYDPIVDEYCVGEPLKKRITYVLNGGSFGIEKGYCVLSLIND